LHLRYQILEKIRGSKKAVSGQALSNELNITRTAIWKHIKQLRKEGYNITAKPRVGYRLKKIPDLLLSQEIKRNLDTDFIGINIINYPKISSTISVAKRMAKKGFPDGTVIVAEQQTFGKGRLGRKWESPKGGIWASVILRPKMSPSEIVKLNMVVSLAIVKAIKDVTGIQTEIKWPNDVLYQGSKVAGVLTEVDTEIDSVNYAIVSFGINVNNKLDKLSANVQETATSIQEIKGKKVKRLALFSAILSYLEKLFIECQNSGCGEILREWKQVCLTIGQELTIKTVEKQYQGKAIDIDDLGRLVLDTDDGQTVALLSGDIVSS